MKIIVTGPQCSGKTTIAENLKKYNINIPVIDEDDEILRRNGGRSPSNWTQWNYKWGVLRPQIQRDIVTMEHVIFFTSFFDLDLLAEAKQKGFMVIQLVAENDILQKRNRDRMAVGVDDATYGWHLNLPYHKELWDKKLIDMRIDTNKPSKELGRSIFDIIQASGISTRKRHPLSREVRRK